MRCLDSQFVLSWRNQLPRSFSYDRSFLPITKLKSHSADETLSGRERSEIDSSLRMGRRRAGFSQGFSGKRSAKFLKNLAEVKKRRREAGWRSGEEFRIRYEDQRAFVA
jgi:hypothetical protein